MVVPCRDISPMLWTPQVIIEPLKMKAKFRLE